MSTFGRCFDKLEAEERERIPDTWRLALGVGLVAALVVASVAIGVKYWPAGDATAGKRSIAQTVPVQRNGSHCRFTPGERPYLEALARNVYERAKYGVPKEIGLAQGKVQLMFAVLPNGSIGEIKVLEGSGNPALDATAIEYIRSVAPCDTNSAGSPSRATTISVPITFQFHP